jgi:glutaredoxin
MVKHGWIDVVDKALVKADLFADRFRKTPRRRLAEVPTPLTPADPFGPPPLASSAAAAPAEVAIKPLGDPGLPAQIFGKRDDDATGRAVMVFREASMTARMINLDDPEHYDVENRLIKETKRYEMPWVFLRGEYIGGFKELAAMAKSGELIKRAGGES